MADELAFGIDLQSVRDRVAALSYFTDVQQLQDATLDLAEGIDGNPPLAYVSTASETASPNRLVGTLDQQVSVRVSVLFCIPAARADGNPRDEVELTRKAVIRILLGWRPSGAEKWLEYDRFLLRASRDGLIWGEVLMLTSYRLTLA